MKTDRRPTPRLLAAVLLLAPLACADEAEPEGESRPIDALVVVQETNLSACSTEHAYSLTVERSCDGSSVPVQVCSDEPLCQAQLDDLSASVAACQEPEETFMASTEVGCGG